MNTVREQVAASKESAAKRGVTVPTTTSEYALSHTESKAKGADQTTTDRADESVAGKGEFVYEYDLSDWHKFDYCAVCFISLLTMLSDLKINEFLYRASFDYW